MYLHLGEDTTILAQDLIMVVNKNTVNCEAAKDLSGNFRSVAVYNKGNMEIIYKSPVSSFAIFKRFNQVNEKYS